MLEQHVRPHPNGTDLLMMYHVRGTFFEAFELHNFPFDGQGLTVTVAILNRADGPFPVDLKVDRARIMSGPPPSHYLPHTRAFTHEGTAC